MLMLVLFSTLILHSVIPHIHHTHADFVSVKVHHAHHHQDGNEHEHSHKENPSEQNDSEDLFGFGLGHHTHPIFNSDYLIEIVRNVQNKIGSKKLACISENYTDKELVLISTEKEVPPKYRDFSPEHPFFLNSSLRGPPSIG